MGRFLGYLSRRLFASIRVTVWVAAAGLAFSLFSAPARAAWLPDGNPVCTASGDQEVPTCFRASDGDLIVVWEDHRQSLAHIYAQKIDPNGSPVWSQDGILVSSVQTAQIAPVAVSDGAGGAIIVYQQQNADADIYAQRLTSAGLLLWGTAGVAVCSAIQNQTGPVITSDNRDGITGLPGAYVAWVDARAGGIYVQGVNSDGSMRFQPDGVGMVPDGINLVNPAITTDGVGAMHGPKGCILAWEFDHGSDADIYGQRVGPGGGTLWGASGVPICTEVGAQTHPTVTFQSQGTAIFAWEDARAGDIDIYAQRFGTQPIWFAGGLPVCRAPNPQVVLKATSDGAGGAIFTWSDSRNGGSNIYGERFGADGSSLWHLDGIPICPEAALQNSAVPIGESDQGAVIAWHDARNGGTFDVYAQRVGPLGSLEWTPAGVQLTGAARDQTFPTVATDASGGLYTAWRDSRSNSDDIYAQYVPADGGTASVGLTLGPDVSCAAAPNPFTNGTAIRFTLPETGRVEAAIFAVDGRIIRTLANCSSLRGRGELWWDGLDANGHAEAAGVYLARIVTDRGAATERLIRIR